jgi:hypothetical protein
VWKSGSGHGYDYDYGNEEQMGRKWIRRQDRDEFAFGIPHA